jgi:alpha-ketoglutarate-dependent 2,4-dichlorophenoxyacetate dioxygenase
VLKDRIQNLTAEHSLWHSRWRAGFADVTEDMRRRFPPARHPLVRRLPNGRTALYIGAHASHVVGLPLEEGRELLDALFERATAPRYIYSHGWRAGDLVIWDNRCTLHRAGGDYDDLTHVRDLRRTTINEHGPEVAWTDLTAGR